MKTSEKLIATCACTRLRTAARLITRVYDEALMPADINASQLAILAAIDAEEATSIAALSKRLEMDRTTLSRNLKPLERAGLIALTAEGWRRSKGVHMTKEGRARLARGAELWESAQALFLRRFGAARWKRVEGELRAIGGLF